MLKALRYYGIVALAGCLFLTQPLMAAEGLKGNLVNGDWLKSNLEKTNVLILDASPAPMYAKQHIPGAIGVDVMAMLAYGIREVPIAEIEKNYQALGISPGKKIVIYDQGGTWFATRLFFSLVYYGFPAKDLTILDGGFFKWQKDGLPVTKDSTPAPKVGTFKIKKLNEGVRSKVPDLVAASGDPANHVLLDALGADWHFGETSFFNKPGHIPNAIMMPSEDLYNPDKTFKSAEEMKKMLAHMGIKPEQQIHAHCGGGGAASVPFFALKYMLNYPQVKLSTESQMGWLNDTRDLPFWTFGAPYMMRDLNWLQSWGGKMMRMYGISNVSLVDVRSADVFNQGHVPFALNVPSDVFKSNIGNPDKLAGVLGPAGINSSHEAVVISGAGLTKEAALAFMMLEKLGQKKVSIYMDSMNSLEDIDKLAQRGMALTKIATAVGPGKKPGDLSIPTTTYSASLRKDIIIADPNGTRGTYPKVFIASGKELPAKTQDGRVVHVPYTELLNGDGTPKAAKDIWNILSKAGVPRYAELVLFSDDPGDAAANYFILKLMGYPDIKVLVS